MGILFRLCLIALACLLLPACQPEAAQGKHPAHHHVAQVNEGSVALTALPAEAQDTLRVIKQGGPYAYDRDGVVFGNFERVLPKQARGYYHEYTVKTPGARNRGARRIIAGTKGEYYYTEDHYQTFRRIQE